MKYKFNPTINFYGRCEEALNFYKESLGGEIIFMQRFRNTEIKVPEEYKDKIIHSEFQADGVLFMASDGMPNDTQEQYSSMIGLSINFSDTHLQEQVYKSMSEGGEILMPLEKTFWQAYYGVFVDKFGVRWEFNCQLEEE